MIKSFIISSVVVILPLLAYPQSYLNQLKNRADYDSLCGTPLTIAYGNVTAIKVLYDIKHDSLYYLSSKEFENHFEFCDKKLNYKDGMGNFFKRNYASGPQRKYLLSNINYFNSNGRYVMDISPIDLMTANQIIQMYKLVKQSTFTGGNLYFLVNSPRLLGLTDSLKAEIPVIDPSEIYGNLSYQAISRYKNTGILRIVEDIEKESKPINPEDIIILKNIPNYLPPVAGIIVAEFQTPLSHISILGLNRKIPICAYTRIFSNKEIDKYIGKRVSFSVKADTFLILPDTSKKNPEKTSVINLKMDLAVDSLIDVNYLTASSSIYTGSKAANFGELYQLSKKADFKTPESAFAIPFYFYSQHIKKSKAGKLIRKLIENTPSRPKKLMKKLDKIQHKIKKTPVDPILLENINNKLVSSGDYTRFRFRSSTNAEDIKGFSGAGLYTSKTVDINKPKKTAEKAIQTVWASLWSYKAFCEREYFNINQENIAMGILVHRAFPDEQVNGVALTKNIYRRNSNGFLVNAQLGDESVVKPKQGVICDQFLCFPTKSNAIYNDKIVVDVIAFSSLNSNKLVMSEQEIQNLANQLEIIKKHFAGPKIDNWSYIRLGYDIEFKLEGETRQLYIKQARPYND